MTTLPTLKFKALVNFPAQVFGRTGITVTKTAGAYYLDLDYSVFTPAGPPPADAAVVFYSPINNSYSIGSVVSVAGIPEAPLDGKAYARKNATWFDAWASPVFTGNPTAPNPPVGDNDASIATTAFVKTTIATVATHSIEVVIDGGGIVLTTGMKGYLEVPFACVVNQATLLADRSGSVVVDIFKCTYAQFDAGSTHPVAGDKITLSTPPTITSAAKSQDAILSGWTTTLAAGDILAFNVNSVATIQRITLSLRYTR